MQGAAVYNAQGCERACKCAASTCMRGVPTKGAHGLLQARKKCKKGQFTPRLSNCLASHAIGIPLGPAVLPKEIQNFLKV